MARVSVRGNDKDGGKGNGKAGGEGMSEGKGTGMGDDEGTGKGTGWFKQKSIIVSATNCLLYTSPSPRDKRQSRMPSSA